MGRLKLWLANIDTVVHCRLWEILVEYCRVVKPLSDRREDLTVEGCRSATKKDDSHTPMGQKPCPAVEFRALRAYFYGLRRIYIIILLTVMPHFCFSMVCLHCRGNREVTATCKHAVRGYCGSNSVRGNTCISSSRCIPIYSTIQRQRRCPVYWKAFGWNL